jgi:hypothetical protein
MASKGDNIVIFTIGRMNPPTPGHMLLIEKLINRAASLEQTKIGIILSHSQDLPKNPFNCEEKRKLLLSGMIQTVKEKIKNNIKNNINTYNPPILIENIDRIEPIIICMDDPTPKEYGNHPIIKSINVLLSNYTNVIERAILIIGEDRVLSYDWILKNLRERTPPIISEIESLPRPKGAISATEIRGYAMSGDKDNFLLKMRSTGLSEYALIELYTQLHELLTASYPVPKKRVKNGGKKYKKTSRRGVKNVLRKTKKNYKNRK